MPCNPSLNNLNPPVIPPIPNPFGIPVASIKIPFPDIDIPTDLLQSLKDLVDQLGALFPSGEFKPNIDEFTKSVLDAISNLLSQIAPFLSFYNFIMALFKLIMCIIEIICAIPNPFKIANAVVKLLRECLPPFLNLLPFLALLLMLLSLLLLILALIEYIIRTIIAFIEEIIRNLTVLARGVTLQSAESVLAATVKISNLMCLIENILAILTALAAIMAIIQALSLISGGLVCDDDDANGCCSPDVCPPFIKESPITGTQGRLIYYKQIGVDVASALSLPGDLANLFNIPPAREERWQLYDTATIQAHSFSEIITPVFDLTQIPPVTATFWPEGISFDAETPASKSCYTVDIRLLIDPSVFNPSDTEGMRYLRVKNCIVVRKPYVGVLPYNLPQSPVTGTNNTGTLNLEGGLVYEDDGTTEYKINGEQATLNTLIHQEALTTTTFPAVDDGYSFSDVEFTMNPGYGALMSYNLITAGCMPSISLEKKVLNNVLIAEDIRSVFLKLPSAPAGQKVASTGFLPNVSGAQACVTNALNTFRQNVSIESAAVFQAEMEACLGDLKDQTLATYCAAVIAAVSQFKSTAELDHSIQFTTRPIITTVTLRDPGGNNVALKMPAECQGNVADKIKAELTLGEMSDFVYDSSGVFKANLTSEAPGDGELKISFDNKIFSTVEIVNNQSTVVETTINYTFIEAVKEPAVRRDATDVAGTE